MQSKNNMKFWQMNKMNLSPYQILTLSFATTILLGTFFLMLPAASQTGDRLPFIDALFTATSAVCVTGLTVVDTGNYFSTFGQMVVIVLIQIGGLGVMTLTTLMAVMLGRRVHLSDRLLVQESLNQHQLEGMVKLVLYVVKVTFLIEFIGGTILMLRLFPDYGWKAVYYGYWHAISGFCNGGFDVFGGTTVFRYATDPVFVITVAGLIMFGGLGFTVIADLWHQRSWKKLMPQTKVVLSMTAFLIFFGTILFFLLEYTNSATIGDMSTGGKLLASLFESVSARTAGFTMMDNSLLHESSMLLMILLMFIGASPASTGGGIKTSTFAIIVASVWSLIRGKDEVTLFSYDVSSDTILRALTIFFLSAVVVFFVTMYLCFLEEMPLVKVIFEVVSAFATVGFSAGITAELTASGKFIMVIVMLMGRVGVVTFAMALAHKNRRNYYHHPLGKFTVG